MAEETTSGFSFSGLGNGSSQTTETVKDAADNGAAIATEPESNNAENSDFKSIMAIDGEDKEPEAKPDNGDKDEGTKAEPEKATSPAWTSQLPAELQGDETWNNFAKLGDLAKAYKALSEQSKDSTQLPSKDTKPEDIEKFYQKLGKPETMDGYELTGDNVDAFNEIAFNANLTKSQAKSVYDAFCKIGSSNLQEQRSQMQKMAVDLDTSLRNEYGSSYGQKMQLLKKGLDTYGGKNIRQKLSATGLTFDSDIIHMFITLGSLAQEATTDNKGTASTGYKSNAEGGRFTFKGL